MRDEHQLLLRVREHLASGRSYREIHAGPVFTRKVLDGIEQSAISERSSASSAAWIAAAAALVIIGVVAVITFLLWPRGTTLAPPSLNRTSFTETADSVIFEDSIGAQWQTFGNLTLMADGGLKPMAAAAANEFRGGGLYWDRQIPADKPVSFEATLSVPQMPRSAAAGMSHGAVQLFVTDDPDFTGNSAVTPHELVWSLTGLEANVVLPDGSVAGQASHLRDIPQNVDVRVAINQTNVVVEVNQQRVYSGPHHLDLHKRRTVGLRFVVGENGAKDIAIVQSARILEMPRKLRGGDMGH